MVLVNQLLGSDEATVAFLTEVIRRAIVIMKPCLAAISWIGLPRVLQIGWNVDLTEERRNLEALASPLVSYLAQYLNQDGDLGRTTKGPWSCQIACGCRGLGTSALRSL